ncbi:MAG: hypothetical protein HQ522_01540 [Bacteroidetes bacterium]|nr:hypothetical protein [Bacteroidota bacterium]
MYEWYVPITILPGIGLLIISTSSLLVNLDKEISNLLHSNKQDDIVLSQKKLKQLNLLNLAMVGFYIGSATFVNSGILMILSNTFLWCRDTSLGFIIVGILAVLVSLCLLILFSFKAVRIRKEQHLNKIRSLKL